MKRTTFGLKVKAPSTKTLKTTPEATFIIRSVHILDLHNFNIQKRGHDADAQCNQLFW